MMSVATLEDKLSRIKLIIFDVDGVLTDGKIYYTAGGDEIKAFHVHDGLGIKLLHQAGIQTAIITSRLSPTVSTRAKELSIEHVYQGQKNKCDAFDLLCQTLQITPEFIAYVGDDLPDLPLMKQVGVSIAVNNAVPLLKQAADFVTTLPGGEGAVREIVDRLLKAQGHFEELMKLYVL